MHPPLMFIVYPCKYYAYGTSPSYARNGVTIERQKVGQDKANVKCWTN